MYLTLLDCFRRPSADMGIQQWAVVVRLRAISIVRAERENIDRIDPAIGERCGKSLLLTGVERRGRNGP